MMINQSKVASMICFLVIFRLGCCSIQTCQDSYGVQGFCVPREMCQALEKDGLQMGRYSSSDCKNKTNAVCCAPENIVDVPFAYDNRVEIPKSVLPVPGEGNCGFVVSNRIARHGTQTSIEEFPWLVQLRYTYQDRIGSARVRSLCGGVLISEKYVLTAAHCVSNLNRESLTLKDIRLGDWNLDTTNDCYVYGVTRECSDPEQDIPVEKITIHPDYLRSQRLDKDIALIRLEKPAIISNYVKPICLPLSKEDKQNADNRLITAGWKLPNPINKIKQTSYVNASNVQTLNQLYKTLPDKTTSIWTQSHPATDFTDNGGALMDTYNDGHGNNYYYVAGISSRKKYYRSKTLHKYHTRVSSVLDWIQETVQP